MKRLSSLSFVFVVGMGAAVQAADVRLFTEDYAPLNFEEEGQIVGIAADQVFEIMKRAGISYEAELTQWSRAIVQGERVPNTCVFATTHNEERDPKFQWIEPLTIDRTILVRKVGSPVAPTTIEEAHAYRVGSQTGDYSVTLLESQGFTNIDLAPAQNASLRKLLGGRIDLMAGSGVFFDKLLADGIEVEEVLELSSSTMSLACSLETDTALVARMQAALQSMIDDGTHAAMQAKYQ